MYDSSIQRLKEGKAIDLWSIPHFLYGILMGLLPPLIGISFPTAFVLLLILGLLWELYEKMIDVKETMMNIPFDFILPIASFAVSANILMSHAFAYQDILVVETAFFILYAYTNISGWVAYRRRKKEFMS
jgi:hypothetical protein